MRIKIVFIPLAIIFIFSLFFLFGCTCDSLYDDELYDYEPPEVETTEDTVEPFDEGIPVEVNLSTITETVNEESGCRSNIKVLYEVNDSIYEAFLHVDGKEYATWSGHTNSQDIVYEGCRGLPDIGMEVYNNAGELGYAYIPAGSFPLQASFTHVVQVNQYDEEFPYKLNIEYSANNPQLENSAPVTNVVLTANGQEWDNSGEISTNRYDGSVEKSVHRDGGVFNIAVIATGQNGDKYTYRRTIEIPPLPGVEPPEDPEYPPPPPPPPQQQQSTLWAKVSAGAQCSANGPECACQLVISLDGLDLTTGTFPVTHATLKVNGEVWHDSGGILLTHYQHVVERTVNCGETFDIELTVNNVSGQTVTSAVSVTTPIP